MSLPSVARGIVAKVLLHMSGIVGKTSPRAWGTRLKQEPPPVHEEDNNTSSSYVGWDYSNNASFLHEGGFSNIALCA